MTHSNQTEHTSTIDLDQPTTIRHGESLDHQALAAYLAEHLPPDRDGATGKTLEIAQFPSGYSNLTYALQWGSQALVLRRPPFGANIQSAHDMGREYRVLSGLRRVTAKVPRPLLYCEDTAVVGAPFYVMERVQGVIIRAGKADSKSLTPALMQQLSRAAIDTLAEIHQLDYKAAGLGTLGRPEGYVDRQIRGWQRRYRDAQTHELPLLDEVMRWLERNKPASSTDTMADSSISLIHNDFKYDNLVLDPADLTRVIAVLDWEMCTLGDPLMDLGTTLGYWMEAGDPPALVEMFGLTALPGNADRRQLVERYAETSGIAVREPLFYFIYGLFKIAVILQQIYQRYHVGMTQDQRFANLDQAVRSYAYLATVALEKGRIHQLNH